MAPHPAKKASQEDWHPADVKAVLHKHNITLMSIAAAHGLTSSSTLSAALVRSYPINERRIVEALNQNRFEGEPEFHPQMFWPSRYNTDGTRKLQGFRAVQSNALIVPRSGRAVNGNVARVA